MPVLRCWYTECPKNMNWISSLHIPLTKMDNYTLNQHHMTTMAWPQYGCWLHALFDYHFGSKKLPCPIIFTLKEGKNEQPGVCRNQLSCMQLFQPPLFANRKCTHAVSHCSNAHRHYVQRFLFAFNITHLAYTLWRRVQKKFEGISLAAMKSHKTHLNH